jgi:hypothetical protein
MILRQGMEAITHTLTNTACLWYHIGIVAMVPWRSIQHICMLQRCLTIFAVVWGGRLSLITFRTIASVVAQACNTPRSVVCIAVLILSHGSVRGLCIALLEQCGNTCATTIMYDHGVEVVFGPWCSFRVGSALVIAVAIAIQFDRMQ